MNIIKFQIIILTNQLIDVAVWPYALFVTIIEIDGINFGG